MDGAVDSFFYAAILTNGWNSASSDVMTLLLNPRTSTSLGNGPMTDKRSQKRYARPKRSQAIERSKYCLSLCNDPFDFHGSLIDFCVVISARVAMNNYGTIVQVLFV
jgi:hypothetical protein